MGHEEVEIVVLKAMLAVLALGLACLSLFRAGWWV